MNNRQKASIVAVFSAIAILLCGCGHTKKASVKTFALPKCEDFAAGSEWDGVSKPTHDNGSWAQSFAVFDSLKEKAAYYEKRVSPEYTFSLAVHDPENSGPAQIAATWANAVAVSTQGKIKINVGFSGTLSGAMTSLDDMKQGLIDFVWTLPCYFKGYMPLTNVIQNPALALPSGSAASKAMWELYQQSDALQKEYQDDGVALFVCANCTSPISYKGDHEIKSISEIHGNIRSNNGPAQLFVNTINASVFSCPIGEVYNNIQHGIIDYLITDWNGIDSFSLSDKGVLNYYIDTNIGCSAFAMLANNDIWNILDEDLKNDILKASGDYMLNAVGIWDYWEALGRYNAVTRGGNIFKPAFDKELSSAYEEVAKKWIASQKDPALAQKLYDKATEISAKYK